MQICDEKTTRTNGTAIEGSHKQAKNRRHEYKTVTDTYNHDKMKSRYHKQLNTENNHGNTNT
jgi:hypothetical protein